MPAASQLFMAAGHRDTIAGLVEGVLGSTGHVVLSGTAGAGKTAVLDAVVTELALGHPLRVVRVNAAAAARPLDLHGFMAQVAGLEGPEDPTDEDVERAFEALTVPDHDRCARIVLLIDGAEALLPEALRYVQFACTLQPRLQVVFSGRPEFEDRLKAGEFSPLRARLARTLILQPLSDEEAIGFIEHRLRAAGLPSRQVMADGGALGTLLRHGQGNPGRISAVLDQARGAARQHGRQDPAPGIAAVAEPRGAVAAAHPTAAAAGVEAAPAPIASNRRRLRRPPAWALVWMGLIVEVTLGTALLAGTAPVPPGTAPVRQVQLAPATGPAPPPVADPPPSPPQPMSPREAQGRSEAAVADARPFMASEAAAVAVLPPPAASGQAASAASMPLASVARARHGAAPRQSLQRGIRLTDTKAPRSVRLTRSVERRWSGWPEQADGDASPPPPVTADPSPRAAADQGFASYIGVYAPGPDGTRTFRAGP